MGSTALIVGGMLLALVLVGGFILVKWLRDRRRGHLQGGSYAPQREMHAEVSGSWSRSAPPSTNYGKSSMSRERGAELRRRVRREDDAVTGSAVGAGVVSSSDSDGDGMPDYADSTPYSGFSTYRDEIPAPDWSGAEIGPEHTRSEDIVDPSTWSEPGRQPGEPLTGVESLDRGQSDLAPAPDPTPAPSYSDPAPSYSAPDTTSSYDSGSSYSSGSSSYDSGSSGSSSGSDSSSW